MNQIETIASVIKVAGWTASNTPATVISKKKNQAPGHQILTLTSDPHTGAQSLKAKGQVAENVCNFVLFAYVLELAQRAAKHQKATASSPRSKATSQMK